MSEHYEIVETSALDENDASQYVKPWLLVGVSEVLEFDTEQQAIKAKAEMERTA